MTATNQLDLRDYLDATSDASKRTRMVTIVLTVASVLVFAGWLNSLQSHWMLMRMKKLGDITGSHTISKLDSMPTLAAANGDSVVFMHAKSLYENRYLAFYSAVAQSFVENSLAVRVPFFGFSFDVNDLGLLGGVGFWVIMICYHFCLAREEDNLKLFFEYAKCRNKLHDFYSLLSMRQVFTVPLNRHIKRTRFLIVAPKAICWLPFIVHAAVTVNDFVTAFIGVELHPVR